MYAANLTDEERETMIAQHQAACENAVTVEMRRHHWKAMRELILGRSASQIAKMERAAGLIQRPRGVAA